MTIAPRVIETVVGRAEFDLTEGVVVLTSHGGIGGVDQARVMLGWLDPAHYQLLSVSRPGSTSGTCQDGHYVLRFHGCIALVVARPKTFNVALQRNSLLGWSRNFSRIFVH